MVRAVAQTSRRRFSGCPNIRSLSVYLFVAPGKSGGNCGNGWLFGYGYAAFIHFGRKMPAFAALRSLPWTIA